MMNPPYGIRMGVRRIEEFYQKICASIRDAAPGAKLAAIVSKPAIF